MPESGSDSLPRWMAWIAFVLALSIGVAGLARPPDTPRFERFLDEARLQMNQGEFDRARKYYRFALTLDGSDAATKRRYETAAMLHRLESMAVQRQVAWLREAHKRTPQDPYIALYAAELAARTGDVPRARWFYSQALALEPGLDYARARRAALGEE